MKRRGARLLLSVFPMVIAGCAEGAESRDRLAWRGTIETVAGVIRVHNPDAGMWTPDRAWRIVEELRIGQAEGEGPEEPRIILHEPADGGYAVSAHWAGVREQGPGRTASLTLEGVVQSAEDRGELLEIIRSVRIDRSAAGAAPTGGDSTGATDATAAVSDTTGAVSDPTSLLTGDEWSVTRLESSETTGRQRPTLLFGADGALTGHGGCNRFRGTFEVTGESVAIGPVMATRMACAEEAANAQETRFFALLEQVTGYRIDGAGGLELLAGERPIIVAQR